MSSFHRSDWLSVVSPIVTLLIVAGGYAPPNEIREVRVTAAAVDQIRCMWHSYRNRGQMSPPAMPLKIFAFAFGQESGSTWASIEVFPGLDNWEVE
jgi:hypothetical protein